MEFILAMLLYIGAVFSPNTYHITEIEALQIAHEPELTAIQNDPALSQWIQDEFADEVEGILVIDSLEQGD